MLYICVAMTVSVCPFGYETTQHCYMDVKTAEALRQEACMPQRCCKDSSFSDKLPPKRVELS